MGVREGCGGDLDAEAVGSMQLIGDILNTFNDRFPHGDILIAIGHL